jgi:hypothetical protein
LLTGDQIQVLLRHADRNIARRRVGVKLAQLQGNALALVAGADAGGF